MIISACLIFIQILGCHHAQKWVYRVILFLSLQIPFSSSQKDSEYHLVSTYKGWGTVLAGEAVLWRVKSLGAGIGWFQFNYFLHHLVYELGKLYNLSVLWFPRLLVGITTESISELLRIKYVKICKALTVPGRMSYYVELYIAILFNYFLAHLIKVETMELKDLPRTTQWISNRAWIRTQLYLTPEPTHFVLYYVCLFMFLRICL